MGQPTPASPHQPAAALPAVTPGPASYGPPGSQPAAPSPLDAQYWSDWNRENFQANQQLNSINEASAYDKIALAAARRQLEDREPGLEQNATNSANASGLLYSGTLGKTIGDMKTALVQNESGQDQAFARRQAARQAQIASITGNLPYQELALRLASIDRANKAATTDALTAPPMPEAASDARGVPRARGHSTAYTGPGLYETAGPASPNLHAIGHSVRYRGPGRYVPNARR